MLLRWIHYSMGLITAIPFLAWNAVVTLIMWDETHLHNACQGVYDTLVSSKKTFLGPKR
jgi:hypothetical protein